MTHRTQRPGKSDFAHRCHGAWQWFVSRGTRHGESDGEIGGRVGRAGTTGHAHEHVLVAYAHTGVAAHDRQHLRQSRAVNTAGHPPRRHDVGGAHQRLHLHQHGACALDGGEQTRANALTGFGDFVL